MKRIIFIILLFCCGNLFSQELILNKLDKSDTIIKYSAFTACYDKNVKESHWSSYYLVKSRLNGSIPRKNVFKADPNIKNISTELCAYKMDNYDIGHLTCAEDMSFSQQSMDECFYFDNVCPQWYTMNRGTWKSLENHCRTLAETSDTLLIISGVIWDDKKTISNVKDCKESIPLPDKFFKILYISNLKEYHIYMFPNAICDKDFNKFEITAEQFEKLTGFIIPKK